MNRQKSPIFEFMTLKTAEKVHTADGWKDMNFINIPTELSVFLGRLVGMPALITAVQEILKKYRPIGKSNRDFVFQLKLNLNVLIMRYATLANFINTEEFPEKSLNLVNKAHNT